MIYSCNNPVIDGLTAALWILAEFLLFNNFEKDMPARLEKKSALWAVWAVCWGMLTVLQIGQAAIPFFYNYFLRISILILYTVIVNQASILLAAYAVVIFYLIKDICKMTLLNVICPFLNLPVISNPWVNIGSIVLCVFMQFWILRWVRQIIRFDGWTAPLKKADIAAILFPAIPYALIKYLQIISYTYGKLQGMDTAVVCLMLCICDLIIFLQTKYWITTQRIREEAEALRLRAETREEWYRQEKDKIAEINRIYHDMKHHLDYIRSLSDNGKIQEYVSSIEEEMTPCEMFSPTGNEVIDHVLAKSGTECARLGIRLIPSVRGEIFQFIEPKDLMVIFGNALDNAKEAVCRLESEDQKEIVVRADARQNFVILRVENHFSGQVEFDRAGAVKTTKEDAGNHGYGIKNIQLIVKRYEGEVTIDAMDGMFILTIMIPER